MKVIGNTIYLRKITPDDVTPRYAEWMNDTEVNKYLESRFQNHSIESIKSFIRNLDTDTNTFFGIFDKKTEAHIGNIKIGNIHSTYKYADLGFLIGDKSFWGKGIATEAIALATQYAFDTLLLNKITAGMYEPNQGSYKAFIKNGYREVGRLKKHVLCDGKYIDSIIVEKLR